MIAGKNIPVKHKPKISLAVDGLRVNGTDAGGTQTVKSVDISRREKASFNDHDDDNGADGDNERRWREDKGVGRTERAEGGRGGE